MKFYYVFIFLLAYMAASSQNLIANGGFEDENICTEYKEPCAPEGWFGNTGGFKNYIVDEGGAYEGSHYLAIQAGRTRNKYQRSYTRAQLLCNLRAGKKYQLQIYMKAATNILDSIGIYFTHTDFLHDKSLLYRIEPTAYVIDQNKPGRGNHGWQQINFIYTANGEEKFLTIANFSKQDINGETGVPSENNFFVYLDAISLTPLNPDEQLCGDWLTAKTLIYELNDRHEFLERSVRFYRTQNKTAAPPELSLTQIHQTKKLVLKDELFIPGRANLQNEGYAMLDNFCDGIKSLSADGAAITTYADEAGETIATDEISLQRAALVREYIRRKLNVQEKFISVNGQEQGKSSIPAASQVKPKKRRMQIVFTLHE